MEKRIIIEPKKELHLVKRDGYGFEANNPIIVEKLRLLDDIIDRIQMDTGEKMEQAYSRFMKHEDNPNFKYGVFKFELCFKGIWTRIFEMYFAVNTLELGIYDIYDNSDANIEDPKMPNGFKLMSWQEFAREKYKGMRVEKLGQDNEKMKPFLVPTTLCLKLDKSLPEILKFAVEQRFLSNFDIAQKFQLGFLRRHYVLMQLIGLGFVSEDCDLGPGKRSVYITQKDYDEIFKD